MRKLLTSKHLLPFQTRAQPSGWLALFVLTLSAAFHRAQAATPQTAPPQLKNLLTQIDAQQTSTMLSSDAVYGENFSHADGLSRQNMEKALTQLWQRYPAKVPDTTAILETQGMRSSPRRLLVLPALSLETAGIRFSGQPLSHGSAMKMKKLSGRRFYRSIAN